MAEAKSGADDAVDEEVSPEVLSKLGTLLGDMLVPLSGLRETTDKVYAGSLAYIDRLILLSGGTLTLTFTALAAISSHLRDLGRDALHPHLVAVECWLLVASIVFGLSYSRLTITLRQKNDQTIVLAHTNLVVQARLLALNPRADTSKLSLPSRMSDEPKTEMTRKAAALSFKLAHIALLGAFGCLALFIQENIGTLLSAGPQK